MTSKVHPWKYEDPERDNPARKGMLLSNQIAKFCDKEVGLLIADEFEEKNLRPAAYTLRIGPDYVDSRGKPGRLDDKKNAYFEMEPNSIVFVSTYEKLDLPFYIAARFNLRVQWVYRGILLGTGPQVEPGFRGYLSCPLYNLTDRPIRIRFKEDFATIDFERTTNFCPQVGAEEIEGSIEKGDLLDSIAVWGEKYLLFKQTEYGRMYHLKKDVNSSLDIMANEVKMWRHIGIGLVISFFALTLTLLSFGNNIYTQIASLARDSRQAEIRLQGAEQKIRQLDTEAKALREQVERQAKPNTALPSPAQSAHPK